MPMFFDPAAIGSATGMLMFVPAFYALVATWHEADSLCHDVLRVYHIARMSLYLYQLPLRFFMLNRLNEAERAPNRAGIPSSALTSVPSSHIHDALFIYCFFASSRPSQGTVHLLLEMCDSREWKHNQFIGFLIFGLWSVAFGFAWMGAHCWSVNPFTSLLRVEVLALYSATIAISSFPCLFGLPLSPHLWSID